MKSRKKPVVFRHKLGLALSGGGTRGFAHIGVFKALKEVGIPVYCVAGTSVGSLMGAAYCLGISDEVLLDFCHTLSDKDFLTGKVLKMRSPSENIRKVADRLFCGATFEQVKTPFSCVAVDLISGNEMILHEGSIAQACAASCAVPVLFTPMEIGDAVCVDGGVLNNIPADVVRGMGADVVVSVDLNHTRGRGASSRKFFDELGATWRILLKTAAYKGQMNSDLIIEPELSVYSNATIANIDEMAQEGYRATMEKLPQIVELLSSRG